MTEYEQSLDVLLRLFQRDYTFVLSTAKDNVPSQRVVDTYFYGGEFWIVTYAKSNKFLEIAQNPNVSLCNNFNIFCGKAYSAGHPLDTQNKEIREKLIKVFEVWYFAHNDESDENMCYIRVAPQKGFFHDKGKGYSVDFINKSAKIIPFSPQIEMTN